MLDLERLRALHAVATYGSVGAAADALGLTPSAISQKLAKLEQETRAKLLEKHGRGVRLTDAAALLAHHAGEILARVEQAESDFEAHRGKVAGTLSIAAFATALRGLLPEALLQLADRYPRLAISLQENEPYDVIRDVERGAIDVGIVQDWEGLPIALPDGVCRASLRNDIADLAVSSRHPLVKREDRTVRLKDIVTESWISSPPGAVCHNMLVHTIRSYDAEPRIVHSAAEYETQLALVASGFGIAILPRMGRPRLPRGVVVLQTKPVLTRSVYAIWRAQVARRPAIRVVVESIREVSRTS